jgi:hypothetical protein
MEPVMAPIIAILPEKDLVSDLGKLLEANHYIVSGRQLSILLGLKLIAGCEIFS